jgi:uncharacterized membrane protein YgaE (UPF0421/DUF939 family)
MAQYIDKDAVVAEIERLKKSHDNWSYMGKRFHQDYETLLSFIDTLEVKESSLEKKAKAYDKAIELAKTYLSITDSVSDAELIELIFPELKEKEDEIKQNGYIELTDFESALFTAFSDAWQQYLRGEEVNVAQWAKEHSAELLEAAKSKVE